jgi:hypothetical protein
MNLIDRAKSALAVARAWWARQWPQISTKIGAVVTTVSLLAPQIADKLTTANPQIATTLATIGGWAGAALIVWNQLEGKAND